MMLRQGSILLLLGMLSAGCTPQEPPTQESSAEGGGYTFPVTFVEIGGGMVEERSEFAGDVASRRHGELAFERAGLLVEMLADEGDRVEAGQVLARLDGSVLEAELTAARAMESAARAQLVYAMLELERYEGMGDAAAETERDQWRSEVSIRTANEAQRNAEALRLEQLLAQGELKAPFAGVLVKRGLTLGGYATPGAMVFEIVDLDRREIRIELPQALAVGLAVGTQVEILGSGMNMAATLDAILPSAASSARTFTGLIFLGKTQDPQQHLLPGAFVRVRLITNRATSETVVPADALVASPAGWSVVVAEEGTPPMARFVPVQLLAADAERVAVAPLEAGALISGARVVVTGTDNVFPGAPLLLHPHLAPTEAAASSAAPGAGN